MQVYIWQEDHRDWPEHEALLIYSQVVCHGIPDQRPLKDGDIINVDVSAYYKGFHGDLNETFVVGNVDDESKKLIRVTAEVRKRLSSAGMVAMLQYQRALPRPVDV